MAKDLLIPTVPRGAIPTPLFSRLDAISSTKEWMNWEGFLSPATVTSLEFEYFAIRNQSTIFDISPMHKYRITGPDALTVVNRLVTRDISKIRDNRVSYVLWCDEEGNLIDDGTIFRFSEKHFRLCCQESMYGWLVESAWGFDVQIVDESKLIAAMSMQGPTSYSILKDAGLKQVATLKPFDFAEIEPGLMISRTGFTGDLGYELWTDWDEIPALWDRLFDAAKHWDLRPIGFGALNVARLEAGFMAAMIDFQPVHTAIRLHRGRSPLELGFEKLVHFDKGVHFNGRRALLKQRANGLKHHLKKVEIAGYKPADGALIYHKKKTEVGHITSGAWSPTTKRNIGLAEFRAPFGDKVTDDLWVEIYTHEEGQWDKRVVPLTIVDKPFFQNPRSRATPPNPY